MANIKVNLPANPFSGQIVTFPAPCDCASVTDGLSINGEIYTVCDAMGNCVTGVGGTWAKGAQVSVVLDCENKKAFIISTGSYAPASHATDKNNPHGVTIAQIGAAPAGFGLGTTPKKLTSADDMNNIWQSGWYYFMSADVPANAESISWLNLVRVDGYTTTVFVQTVYGLTSSASHAICSTITRRKYSDNVTPWEWVNPAMITNTEYRTTERIHGKAVYKKFDGTSTYYRIDGETEWRSEGTKIATGSYTGTGTQGSSNPTTITCGFKPKLVIVAQDGKSSADLFSQTFMLWEEGRTTASRVSDDAACWYFTQLDTGLKWYCTYSASGKYQLNAADTVYHWIAIG